MNARWLAGTSIVAWLLLGAAPAHAQRFIEHHTIDLQNESIWPGERLSFGGLYWQTAYGVCPAEAIQISFEQERRPTRVIGHVPATSVIPFSGGFSSQVTLPEDARIGRGVLRFVQREREVSPAGRCVDSRLRGERGVGLQVHRRPLGAPCTPDNGCASAPVPTLELVAPPGPPYVPGVSRRVLGHDYSDPSDRVCPPKRGFAQVIGFYLTDASGTSHDLGSGRAERDGELHEIISLPPRGLAPGRAVLTAVPIGYEGDPVCGRPGTTTLTITVPRPTLTFDRAPAPGARVTVGGDWWRTDRCDSRVDVVLVRHGVKRVLRHVKPGSLGSFEATVKIPGGKGPDRIVAVQRRWLEVPDRLGRAKRSRCVRRARTRKTERVSARKAPAVPPVPAPIGPPAPAPTPPPTPAPAPDPTLTARQTGPDSLRLTGSHWERGDCDGKANPVTITLAHAGKPAETIGTATPDAAGAFATEFSAVTVSPGDEARASQTRCDGSALSATATVSAG